MDKELIEEINELKEERGAIIIAHNYQLPEVQDLADFTGDSLELARKASKIDNELILFCGVYFMAETAKILNPDKSVLIPDKAAGCPLADFATGEQVREWREKYPDYGFVAYINTNADVKAEVDICCTSSNAVKIVESMKQDKIVFLPDQNLGSYVQEQTKKELKLWRGYCVVHHTADSQSIKKAIEKNPGAVSMAHPECPKTIRDMVDEVCSTGQMFGVVERYKHKKDFIVVTEWGMNYALQRRFPDKNFIEPERRLQCRNMKRITPEKIRGALKSDENDDKYNVTVDSVLAERAKKSIDKMLEL